MEEKHKMIPDYITTQFCNDLKFNHCEYYMHKKCPETCGYAREIKGIGAIDLEIAKKIKKNIEDLSK